MMSNDEGMRKPHRRMGRLATLAGFAAGGLLVAHALTYHFVVPSGIHRHALLVNTGHAYMPFALLAGAGAVMVAAVVTAAMGYLRTRDRQGAAPALLPVGIRLSSVQVVAFGVLEVLERVLAGAPLSDLAGPLLWIGFVVQVLVGLVGAMLVVGLDHVGAELARGRRSVRRRGPQVLRPASERSWSSCRVGAPYETRAPPTLLPSAA